MHKLNKMQEGDCGGEIIITPRVYIYIPGDLFTDICRFVVRVKKCLQISN